MEQEIAEGFRLSPQQRRLWSLLIDPQRSVDQQGRPYRVQAWVEIDGEIDLDALHRAFARLVERWEVLRTRFVCLSGMTVPLQVVGEDGLIWRDPIRLEKAEPGGRKARIEQLFEAMKEEAFALEKGFLLRVEPVILAPARYGLLIALSGLCCDAVSLELLIEQLTSAYHELVAGTQSRASAEEMQYIDLAEWQNDLLEAAEPAEQALWRDQQLWNAAWTTLPGEFCEAATTDFLPQVVKGSLPEATRAALAAQDLTPEIVFLACWQLLLARLSGRDELTVGVAFAGRRYAELETALGLFERYLPLRLELGSERSFSELAIDLARQWQQVEEAQEFVAPNDLAEAVAAKGKAPFLPFCFDYRIEAAAVSAEAGGPVFSIARCFVCTDAFHLRLSCQMQGDQLNLAFYYDGQRFPNDAVECLAAQWRALVVNAVTEPTTPIGQLSFLGPEERQQLLFGWTVASQKVTSQKVASQPGPNRFLHQRFEEQARKSPASPALVFEETRLSYDTWNRQANQLAHHLRRYQVRPGDLVAICLERSAASLIAMLAVHKAGAAYAVLDLAQPASRLALMLDVLQAAALITRTPLIAGLPLLAGQESQPTKQICLDLDRAALEAEADTDLSIQLEGAHLAYVLFTSGSSGRPKGVGVEHRNLLNYLDGLLERLDPPPGASYATVSTLAADLGNSAIFPAMATGGCLHLVSLERAMDSKALAEYFESHAIDYLKIVPSHLGVLLESSNGARMLPRKGLLIGGELFRWELAQRLGEVAANEARIFNHYGPTEATVGVLTFQLGAEAPRGASVPLGLPIRNTRAYLLDHACEPVPVGMPGELSIGGDSLSRGYLRRPGSTASRFVPDPWTVKPGRRLYRTGDRVRMLSNGAIEYLGRVDHQIKIRGFRIELGEIEAILNTHPRVHQVVVVIRRGDSGEARLLAYVVATETDRAGLPQELRRWAAQHLPPYMVPAALVQLEALPLSPNGKIDRQALPEPEPDHSSESRSSAAAPGTPIEEILANLWAQLLKVERVGIGDNFLELGGHSLLAMQLVARVREIYGVEVPLGEFLTEPTVSALGTLIEHRLRLGPGSRLPSISVADSQSGSLPPLSFSQERYWLWRHPKPNTVSRNELAAFRLTGSLDIALFHQVIGKIIARHQILRTSYAEHGGRPVQIIHDGFEVRMPVVDMTLLSETDHDDQLRRYIDRQDAQLFDLESAPIFRLTLFRLAEERHLFLFVMHHIAVDGWSWAILRKEMFLLYEALVAGRENPLGDLPIQYTDFAFWQQKYFTDEVWYRQIAYWREKLDGVIPSPNVPTDRPRPKESSYRGAVERFELSEQLTRQLEATSRQQNVTLFITLLAAFKTVLYRYTGESELSVLSLFANRNKPEIENLVGCFMNVLPLRTQLNGIETFAQLLARVRETTLGAYSRPDIPFDRLLREVVLPQLPEKVHELFVFRILFALGGSPELISDLPGLKIDLSPVKSDRMYNDFLIRLRPLGNKLVCTVKYNTDLFEEERVITMGKHYLQVLEAVVEDPELQLDAVLGPLVT